ncbi:toprim domain-containing protein [Macrococcoides caseolyticum]|uniref:toprim domain-containing protein n=1 Tax=Macrococcoides caseolyticum TaxID=69966 RepID=UPI000C33FFF0|nr:toprim domain-containing protein [Macrococcus caseolyticus]PKE61007.1 topiosmerase [Macrococcus caseolyticus]
MSVIQKVIVVEGKRDKKRLQEVLTEPVHIICTHGTMGIEKLDAMIEDLYHHKVYIMTDSDNAGRKIRNWFKRHLSEGHHIYIDPKYGEVSNCPLDYLAKVVSRHDFEIKEQFEWKGKSQPYEYQNAFAI